MNAGATREIDRGGVAGLQRLSPLQGSQQRQARGRRGVVGHHGAQHVVEVLQVTRESVGIEPRGVVPHATDDEIIVIGNEHEFASIDRTCGKHVGMRRACANEDRLQCAGTHLAQTFN